MAEVSVIIPIYNTSPYLDELMTQMNAQTFQDIELICVDDGSTDNSAEIIKEHAKKDSRIKYIYQENSGAGIARNTGIAAATGKYVICLDSDDIYKNELIEKLYKKAEETQADIVITLFGRIYKDGHISHNKGLALRELPADDVFNRHSVKNILSIANQGPCNKLYNVEFIKKYNLKYSGTKICNDVSFALSALALADKITTVKEELSLVRYMNDCSLTSKREKSTHCAVQAFEELYENLQKFGIFEELKENYLKTVGNSIHYNLTFPINERFIECLKEYLKTYPWSELPKEKINEYLMVKRTQKRYIENCIFNCLMLGLNKHIKNKIKFSGNFIKAIKLLEK